MNKTEMRDILEERLANTHTEEWKTVAGEVSYEVTRVIKVESLDKFLDASLIMLNGLLPLKNKVSFGQDNIEKFADLIVHGALLSALSSQALIERGREFTQQDGGVTFDPPKVSDMLMHQWMLEKDFYLQKIKLFKV